MNLEPPPRNATIQQLEKWCRNLYHFLQLPDFESIKFNKITAAPKSEEGIMYLDSDDDTAKIHNGTDFQDLY